MNDGYSQEEPPISTYRRSQQRIPIARPLRDRLAKRQRIVRVLYRRVQMVCGYGPYNAR